MNKRLWASILCAMGLLLLILDAKTSLQGASQGLLLCLQTVIPSLFPFFVLSILLTGMLSGVQIPLLRPLGKLCGIPKGCESLFLIGILGGYPTGAQSASQMHRSGILSKADAERMLAICNLAGPSFLFGIVASQFAHGKTAWYLWLIHISSAILTAMVLPEKSNNTVANLQCKPVSLPHAVHRSVQITGNVCGWIIVFRVILAFANRWFLWLLPAAGQVILTGMLELANGCCELSRIPQEGLRFLVAAGILSFGGLCVTMQTAAVTDGLSLRWYFPGKILQTLFSLLLAGIWQLLLFSPTEQAQIGILMPVLICASIAVTVKILHKPKNNSSIPALIGV